ncbi:MAG: hypothetical protein ABSC94_27970 [Polyangiaceae bacterium]|jgi:hypothetical protein
MTARAVHVDDGALVERFLEIEIEGFQGLSLFEAASVPVEDLLEARDRARSRTSARLSSSSTSTSWASTAYASRSAVKGTERRWYGSAPGYL